MTFSAPPRVLLLLLLAPTLGQARGGGLPAEPSALVFARPVTDEQGRLRTVVRDGVLRVLLEEESVEPPLAGGLRKDPALILARRIHRWFQERRDGGEDRPLCVSISVLLGDTGPIHHPFPAEVARAGGETLPLDSFLSLSPFPAARKELPTLDELAAAGLLGRTLVHEIGHLLMFEAYRPAAPPSELSGFASGMPRDVPIITDPPLAFSEGFAEALEALAAVPLEEAMTPVGPGAERMTRLRHEWLVQDRYVWEDLVEKTGRPLTGFQVVSREGFVGSQLHEILTHRVLAAAGPLAALEQVITVLEEDRPRDYPSFLRASLVRAPERREILLRILLEGARYTTMDPAAADQVAEVYRLGRALKRTHPESPDRLEARNEVAEAAARWKSHKEELFAQARGGEDPFRALPAGDQALWLQHGRRRVSLNLAPAEELGDFLGKMLRDPANGARIAVALVTARQQTSGRFFLQLAEIQQLLDGAVWASLELAHRSAQATLAAPAARRSSAYLTPDPSLLMRAPAWLDALDRR